MLQYFVAGIVAYDWKQYLAWCKRVPLAAAGLAFFLVEGMPYMGIGGGNSTLTAAVGIAFIFRLSYSMEGKVESTSWGKIVILISTASYIIYLLHTTFEGFAKAVIFKLPYLSNLSDDFAFTIGSIIVIGTGVVVPITLYVFILQRTRFTRMLFGLK